MQSYDPDTIYAQYRRADEKPFDRWFRVKSTKVKAIATAARTSRRKTFLAALNASEHQIDTLSDFELAREVWQCQPEIRRALVECDENSGALIQALACVRELSKRLLGMRHHDVQMLGALSLLMGRVAEMQTGEGKSLTAVPAAAIAAISGFPVHVITVNGYLAERDAAEFSPVFNALGLEVGLITEEMDPSERSVQYRKQVVYCTNKDVAFDYLKDQIAFEHFNRRSRHLLAAVCNPQQASRKTVLAGLFFALIDEADSVLLDEAGTPLVIARDVDSSQQLAVYSTAIELAKALEEGLHYRLDRDHKLVVWLPAGEFRIVEMAGSLGGIWSGPFRMRELLGRALTALFFYQSGHDYVVYEDKVQIIDAYTGRRMPDRSWEAGLHQLIEVKEGVELTTQRETLAKTTFQRFFRRYWRISGMSGTISEVAEEVDATYGMGAEPIPTNKPQKRVELAPQVFKNDRQKLAYLLSSVLSLAEQGRPVLIGTRSVAESDIIADILAGANIEHRVLNAVQDREEAEIVAQAGQLNRVTVATNMAGRGTDIKLSAESRSLGGLHVIATGIHDSRRIDRQLCGRCARQGDPGSYQLLCSFEDPLVRRFLSPTLLLFGEKIAGIEIAVANHAAYPLIRLAQRRAERANFLTRKDLMNTEDQMAKSLGFTGLIE